MSPELCNADRSVVVRAIGIDESRAGAHHILFVANSQPADDIDRRQDLPNLLSLNGGVIAVTASCLQQAISGEPHSFLGTDRRGIETRPGSVIDVDDAIDLAVAEAMLTQQTTGVVS